MNEAERRGYKKVRITKDVAGWPVDTVAWHDLESGWAYNDDCSDFWSHTVGESCEYVEDVEMSEYKVGDRVKVVANNSGHEFNLGDDVMIGAIENQYGYSEYTCYRNNGDYWYLLDSDIEPIVTAPPSRFELGKTYKTAEQGDVICVYIHPNGQALCLFDRHVDKLNTAYVWNADGTYDSALPHAAGPYRIVFEPVVEGVTEDVTIGGVTVAINYRKVDGVTDLHSASMPHLSGPQPCT